MMQHVVGVRFQEAARIYYFSPAGFADLEPGEYVVVETSRGLEIGRVVVAPSQVVNAELSEPLKPIVRMAEVEDLERAEFLQARARAEMDVVRAAVRQRELPMKAVNASYSLDGMRLTVFFTSEGRVDFRDLLRDLSRELGSQVQLRQIGPRDQAKAVDGYGICGRRLCCSSWLTSFPAISIKMAKEQNKPLTPSKISGQCGRLLCCLSYENDMYRQLKATLPRPGTVVSTPAGTARVVAANALRQTVLLHLESGEMLDAPASALAIDRGVVRILELPTEERAAEPIAVVDTPPSPDQPARGTRRGDDAAARGTPDARRTGQDVSGNAGGQRDVRPLPPSRPDRGDRPRGTRGRSEPRSPEGLPSPPGSQTEAEKDLPESRRRRPFHNRRPNRGSG